MKGLKNYIVENSLNSEFNTVLESSDKNLSKLSKLCEIVNKRYAKGLNDDDQVSAMYKFADSVTDVVVAIGWDKYYAYDLAELVDGLESGDTTKEETKDGVILHFKVAGMKLKTAPIDKKLIENFK